MGRRLTTALGCAALLTMLVAAPVSAEVVIAPNSGPNTGGTTVSISGGALPPFQRGTEVRISCGATAYVVETVVRAYGDVLEFVTPDVSPFVGACDVAVFEPWQPWRNYVLVGQFTSTGVGPTRLADCRDGGWQAVSEFRNQGDCITFVIANELRGAGVDRLDVDYQLISLGTDTAGFWPLEPGRIYVTWHIDFSTFGARDADGRRTGHGFGMTRQEMWLIEPASPGHPAVIGGRMTLYGTSNDWTFEVAPPARAVRGSGTVTLYECSSGCPLIGTASVTASGTATDFYHYADRLPFGDGTPAPFMQMTGWDNSITGEITIDGVAVASGLTGWIQDVKTQRMTVRP